MEISPSLARRIALHAQGLVGAKPFGQGKPGVLRAIQQLGYIQVDTISVVERAHHHILRCRVPGYRQAHLHRLQDTDRRIFEYWAHAAAYLPMEDYRFALPRMLSYRDKPHPWFAQDPKFVQRVLDVVKDRGPMRARDFDQNFHAYKPDTRLVQAAKSEDAAGWWNWKPAKKALDLLWMQGRLLVDRREGFQKVYDLAERIVPTDTDHTLPSEYERALHIARNALRADGLVTPAQAAHLRSTTTKARVAEAFDSLVDSGEAVRCLIDQKDNILWYMNAVTANAASRLRIPRRVYLLSPFDGLVIRRKRCRQLFDFDYTIECYIPAPKRRYGYYSLPILWGEHLVGRLDPKADRINKTLIINSFNPEPRYDPVVMSTSWQAQYGSALAKALQRFAVDQHCESINLGALNAWIQSWLRYHMSDNPTGAL